MIFSKLIGLPFAVINTLASLEPSYVFALLFIYFRNLISRRNEQPSCAVKTPVCFGRYLLNSMRQTFVEGISV